MLQSYHRGNLTLDRISNNFRARRGAARRQAAQHRAESRSVAAESAGPSEQRILDYIRSIYAGQARAGSDRGNRRSRGGVRAQVSTAAIPGRSARVRGRGRALPGRCPSQRERDGGGGDQRLPPPTWTTSCRLLPETRQVFMVTGSGPIGQFWNPQLAKEFKRFEGRLTFIKSSDLTVPEILRRCANLPRQSAIFYITMGSDAQGGSVPRRTGSRRAFTRPRMRRVFGGAEHHAWPRYRRRLDDPNRRAEPKHG